MKIELDFPLEGYTKGDLIKFCFGENANKVDTAIPIDLARKINEFFDNISVAVREGRYRCIINNIFVSYTTSGTFFGHNDYPKESFSEVVKKRDYFKNGSDNIL